MNRGMTKGMSYRLPGLAFMLAVTLLSLAASCNAQAWKCLAFWSKSPFKQLDCYLTRSTSSNELGENLSEIKEFLEQQQLSGQTNRKKLLDAAVQFASLSIFEGGDHCRPEGTRVLTNLEEAMVKDFGDELKSNNIRLYRVVQLHQGTMKRHFKACWQQYTNKWEQFKPDQELGPIAAKVLDTLADGLRETHCRTPKYNGFEPSIKAYLCAKQQWKEPLTKSVWPIVKSLEEFVKLRDETGDEEANQKQQPAGDQTDRKSKLYLLASEGRETIEKLLERAFYEPCQNLVQTNEMARQTIARVPQLIGLLPTLERLDRGDSTDQLLEWTYRQQICERLLNSTKLAKLTDEVMKWIEDRSKRQDS